MENFKIENILLPTDFSKQNESAIRIAIAICKRQQAKLTMLHAIDKFSHIDSKESLIPAKERKMNFLKRSQKELKAIAAKLSQESQVEIETIVDYGNPADVICTVAKEDGFSMIVVGAHGASGFREDFMGATAFRVLKNAPCPVLSVRGDWDRLHFKKIVYPIRQDQKVFEKYNYLAPIIEQNNAEIIIAGLADKDNSEQISETVFFIDLLRNMCQEERTLYSTVILPCNNYATKITEIANHANADMIVISANLDYTAEEFSIGPFAQLIVNRSKCPVLSIRPALGVKK